VSESNVDPQGHRDPIVRTVARWVLGGALLVAGIGHLTAQRQEFQAQVPSWFPGDPDVVVVVSGIVEIVLGVALILAGRHAAPVGVAAAAFFVIIFPGNIAQFVEQRDAFGLDSDAARFARLFFQPVLVVWALWSTGGWTWLRQRWHRAAPRAEDDQ
jgi:uncharacterized membrane protein